MSFTDLLTGGGGTALLGAVAYAAKKGADAWRERSKKRVEAEAADAEMKRLEAAADAKHERKREELEATSDFQKTEALIASVHSLGKRLDRAEERLDRCESEKRNCHEALDAERKMRRADIDAAKAECEKRILAVAARVDGVRETVDSLSPPRGTPKQR